jgi:hypothetical protein
MVTIQKKDGRAITGNRKNSITLAPADIKLPSTILANTRLRIASANIHPEYL